MRSHIKRYPPPAHTYYLDATAGLDTNKGNAEDTPWQTITKVNAFTFKPGDRILSKKAETWREKLLIPSSGSAGKSITFGAYGSGAAPRILGSDVPSSWTSEAYAPIPVITKVQGPLEIGESDASVTRAWTSTPIVGNLLVAIGKSGNRGIADASIAGWTLAISVQAGTASYMGIWYKVAGAAEGDVTLNWTSSTTTILIISEWSGLSVAVLDKTASTATTGGAVTSRSSGTTANTTTAVELCIAGFATGDVTSAQSFTNSFVDEYSSDIVALYMASLITAATSIYETTMAWTTSRVAGGCIATFMASGTVPLYYTAQASDPLYIWFVDLVGTIHNGNKVATKDLLLTEYDWWWDDPNNRLYIYAATDPLTRYTSVEVTNIARDRGIMWGTGIAYEIFDGFEVAYVTGNGIVIRDHSQAINNHVHHLGDEAGGHSFGIELNQGANSRIAINIINDTLQSGIFLVSSNAPFNCQNNIVELNTVYDCLRALAEIRCEASTLLMLGNIIRYNNLYHSAGFTPDPTMGQGILLKGLITAACDATQIYYNIFSVKKAGIYSDTYVTNTEIYNNTIVSAAARGIYIPSTGTSGWKIKNNIISIQGALPCITIVAAASVAECDYNCYWNPAADPIMWHWNGTDYTKSQFAAYQAASGLDAHSIVADPVFVSASNFHLQVTSPCRGAGVALGFATDYDNITLPASPAIGAYEYV